MRLAVFVTGLLYFAGATYTVRFRNVAASAGLTASFPNGGQKTKRFILETTGSGVAFLDYDVNVLGIQLHSTADALSEFGGGQRGA